MINSVRCAELGEACLARKKHIITCSGAPWHAVLNPAEWWRWVALAQCKTLGEKQSKNGHNPKVIPVVIDYQCFHFGRGTPRPYEMVFNILCVL